MRQPKEKQTKASTDTSAGPPLNLPSSGVKAIDHCWATPLQGTSMGFGNVSAVVVRWDSVPKKTVPVEPLGHVSVPVTVATPVLGSNWPKRSTLSWNSGVVSTERFSV